MTDIYGFAKKCKTLPKNVMCRTLQFCIITVQWWHVDGHNVACHYVDCITWYK